MKNEWIVFLALFCLGKSFAQAPATGMDSYAYASALSNVSDTWHKIVLPQSVFGEVKSNFADIRVFGITAEGDTIEAPYLLNIDKDEVVSENIASEIINTVKNNGDYYFTFAIPAQTSISHIDLSFGQDNFDWRVDLEGSQDQNNWFGVLEDYRILSIKNASTNFSYTALRFPAAQYKYFRLRVKSNEKPKLRAATLQRIETDRGEQVEYKPIKQHMSRNKEKRTTEIIVRLPRAVPISKIEIPVQSEFDYYRPVSMEQIADSFQTEVGWKYGMKPLSGGTLHSLAENDFGCYNKIAKDFKITIFDGDNQPLDIDEIKVYGNTHSLTARFNIPAQYYLVYGNKKAKRPQYDIARFTDKIPEQMSKLALSNPILQTAKDTTKDTHPLFENPVWLWSIMIVIILVLGGFTLKMLGGKKEV